MKEKYFHFNQNGVLGRWRNKKGTDVTVAGSILVRDAKIAHERNENDLYRK
jgi:hypothetical protein